MRYKVPIEYKVSKNGLRIKTVPKGYLDFKATKNYFDNLKNDKRIKPGAVEVVLFDNVTDFEISDKESERIAHCYQETKALRLIGKTIFVCGTLLGFGIARMLKAFHGFVNPDHIVEVVKSESEIEEYIKESN